MLNTVPFAITPAAIPAIVFNVVMILSFMIFLLVSDYMYAVSSHPGSAAVSFFVSSELYDAIIKYHFSVSAYFFRLTVKDIHGSVP